MPGPPAHHPGTPCAPNAAQQELRDHREARLESSHGPAAPLHFSPAALSAVTFPTAIDRKHFIAFPGGSILGVALISVSMVTSSGLRQDLAFLGWCWVVETGEGGGCILCCCQFCLFFFFLLFQSLYHFRCKKEVAKLRARCLQSARSAGRGPGAAFIPRTHRSLRNPTGPPPVPTPLSPSTPPGFPCSRAGSCSATQRGRSTAYFAPRCCCLLLPLPFFLPSPAEEEEEGHGHGPSPQDPAQKGHQSTAQWDAACHLNACKWFLPSCLHLRRWLPDECQHRSLSLGLL